MERKQGSLLVSPIGGSLCKAAPRHDPPHTRQVSTARLLYLLPLHPVTFLAAKTQDLRFTWAVMMMILCNTAILAAVWYPMPPMWAAWQGRLNCGFTLFFALELGVKLMGLGVR